MATMRKIPIPEENRKKSEKLFEGKENGIDIKPVKEKDVKKEKTQEEIHDGSKEISEKKYPQDTVKKRSYKSAEEYALMLVSSHTYTERALFLKIKSKKVYSDKETQKAIDYVKRFGYINDRRLAQDSVERLAAKCYGRIKICRYLAAKGIPEEIIEELDFSGTDFIS